MNTSTTKISIITPCYNAEQYIGDTIKSVLGNTLVRSGGVSLEYLICDGGSKDRTTQIAHEIFSSFRGNNVQLKIISEPDVGMYDALAKGLRVATGDICSYINAGDLYSPTAFEVVSEVLSTRSVSWLSGFTVWYNEKNHLTDCLLPYKYRSRLVQCGMYGTLLPFIQQESTFWRRSLNDAIDYERLATFRYAGDFFLWQNFSKVAQLYVVSAWLGGFKHHRGQLSEDFRAYVKEMKEAADMPTVGDYLMAFVDKPLWYIPNKLKKFFAGKFMYSFDQNAQRYVPGRTSR